jgi:hypothetical protein
VITSSSKGSCRTGWPLPGSPAGLAGLIAWPVAEPVFLAEITGAQRQRWSPHLDTRQDALAACYQFLLDAATGATSVFLAEVQR